MRQSASSWLNAFKRPTGSSNYIPEIDGLRFFAIFTVLIFHLNTSLADALGIRSNWIETLGGKDSLLDQAWWLVRLDLGVKVFFAISGMVLALPFLKKKGKIGLKNYYLRRLNRLEPPFIISLLLLYAVHVLVLKTDAVSLVPNFFAGLLYSHVILFGYPNPINPVTWSLETEAQFYLLVPLLFYVYFRNSALYYKVAVLIAIFFFGIYFRSVSLTEGLSHWSSSVLAYFSNFTTGVVFAIIWINQKSFWFNKNIYWDIVGVLATIGLFYFYKPQAYWLNNLMFNVCIFFVFTSTFKSVFLNWFYTLPIIYTIGGMCYSIYLIHLAFFHLLIPITSKVSDGLSYGMSLLMQMVIAIPITIFVSSIFYLLFERPFMSNDLISRRLLLLMKKK